MRHPPWVRKLVDKTQRQNTGTDMVILEAGRADKVWARRSRYLRLFFIFYVPWCFGCESTGRRPPAQVLDLFSHFVADRTSDDQPIGPVVLFAPTCEMILLPFVHDLTEFSILRFVLLVLLFLGQLLPVGI